PNAIKSFYQASKQRTGTVRHGRLNTQRKILEAMWLIWLLRRPFDPNKFVQTQPGPQGVSCSGKASKAEGEEAVKHHGAWAQRKSFTRMTPDQSLDRDNNNDKRRSVWRECSAG